MLIFLLCFIGMWLSYRWAKHEGWEATLGRFAYLLHGTILYANILLFRLWGIKLVPWMLGEWPVVHRAQLLLTEVGILIIKMRIHGR